MTLFTRNQLEEELGSSIKAIRLLKNITRENLCEQAGVSMNALRHLEGGEGATLKTLISIIQAFGKEDWLRSIMPVITINPLDVVNGRLRLRAGKVRIKDKHDLHHKRGLLKKYGLTIESYITMHKLQEGKCGNPGCRTELDLKSQNTHIDHNHATGATRSLLCSYCNHALGFLHENKNKAQGLIEYIEKHNE